MIPSLIKRYLSLFPSNPIKGFFECHAPLLKLKAGNVEYSCVPATMSETKTILPVDAANPDNLWCSACSQSLKPASAAAHLKSKKHLTQTGERTLEAPADDAPKKKAESPKALAKADAPKKARSTLALPPDPNRQGYHWCGLCEVSLSEKQADKHLDTKSHQANAEQHLARGIGNMGLSAKKK
jgi:hypothetical protein